MGAEIKYILLKRNQQMRSRAESSKHITHIEDGLSKISQNKFATKRLILPGSDFQFGAGLGVPRFTRHRWASTSGRPFLFGQQPRHFASRRLLEHLNAPTHITLLGLACSALKDIYTLIDGG